MKKEKCCICGEIIEGYGNNPYPLKNKGRCCDICNMKVIEERLKRIIANKKKSGD